MSGACIFALALKWLMFLPKCIQVVLGACFQERYAA
jgi:hypothetical protein